MTTETTDLYVDHESPQACQALAPMRELERNLDVTRDWLPHTLDIPAFPGSAGVDREGAVIAHNRTAHQWRRVKYS